MKALLVRVGADQSEWGGWWTGRVDSKVGDFVYVPIPDDGPFHPGLATPYSLVASHLGGKWPSLPGQLARRDMHLDPDFAHLTYGDQGQRAVQITSKLGPGDLLVFYSGLRDLHPNPRLVYAIIGVIVIDAIVPIASVQHTDWHQNAHTRRSSAYGPHDIVVRGKAEISGRCDRAIPIGHFDQRAYRVLPSILATWGGLSVKDGYLQRSARLPQFLDAGRFLDWFNRQGVSLVARNN
jgi:hypothetical protein